jgi:hypothetical protein
LKGVDPRRWDLHQLLAAFEATLRQGAKDEADWRRTRNKLYAAPREERAPGQRRPARPEPRRGGMTLEAAQALIGSADAEDALYG